MGNESERDARLIFTVSEVLGVTEFELFADAYAAWYQRIPTPQETERHFVRYMFRGVVPVWVRHYVRSQVTTHALSVEIHADPTLAELLCPLPQGLVAAVGTGLMLVGGHLWPDFLLGRAQLLA